MNDLTLFTIGHSNHSSETFVAMLQQHGIEQLVDVRSQPFSRYNPQFNRETLAIALRQAEVKYSELGKSLGGRPEQSDLYDPGQERPNYERQRKTTLYRQGVQTLIKLARQGRTAIMCSEGDPNECHRTWLITPSLLDESITVLHILPDAKVVTAERPLMQMGFDF